MDTLTNIKCNKLRKECQQALRAELKKLGLGHSDLKQIIKKLDEDCLNARNLRELETLADFIDTFKIYLNLI